MQTWNPCDGKKEKKKVLSQRDTYEEGGVKRGWASVDPFDNDSFFQAIPRNPTRLSEGHRVGPETSPEFNHPFPAGHERGGSFDSRARELYQCKISVPLSKLEAAAAAALSNTPTNVVPLESPRFANPFPKPSRVPRLAIERPFSGYQVREISCTDATEIRENWFGGKGNVCLSFLKETKRDSSIYQFYQFYQFYRSDLSMSIYITLDKREYRTGLSILAISRATKRLISYHVALCNK